MVKNRESISSETSHASRTKPCGETILIVEDEVTVRNLVTRFLTLSGYHVLAAEEPRAALTIWAEHKDKVALLLTDVILPGALSGRALALRLQAEQPGLKVLYTSGYSADSLNADGTLDHNIHFFHNHYCPEQLLDADLAMLAGTLAPQQNQNQYRYAETTTS